tara:strand:- start:1380 stop:2222 length:843 start_codon:yes stop_codon:yes gene_type:complete
MEVRKKMNSQELRSIQEAYLEVVENQQLDEITASMGRRAKEYNRKKEQDAHMARQKDHQDKMKNDPEYAAKRKKIDAAASSRMGKGNPRYDASAAGSSRVKGFKFTPEELDIFDVVLEFLQAEGYAETLEEAEWMMANLIDEEAVAIILGEDSRRMSNKQHTARIRSNIKSFGNNYTPPSNYDTDANRGQGEVLTRKQIEKKRRKALRQEAFEFWLDEAMSSYDRNRKRAAQRAADRNAARAAGKTGVVPGVGYVSPRKERETYTDEKGTVRHKSGAKMP